MALSRCCLALLSDTPEQRLARFARLRLDGSDLAGFNTAFVAAVSASGGAISEEQRVAFYFQGIQHQAIFLALVKSPPELQDLTRATLSGIMRVAQRFSAYARVASTRWRPLLRCPHATA